MAVLVTVQMLTVVFLVWDFVVVTAVVAQDLLDMVYTTLVITMVVEKAVLKPVVVKVDTLIIRVNLDKEVNPLAELIVLAVAVAGMEAALAVILRMTMVVLAEDQVTLVV